MNDERWVVLGLAHPRAAWFTELARWSTTAAIPVEFLKCVSADEVRARLVGGRAHSALFVGGDVIGLDRDLVDAVRTTGAAVIVVDAPAARDWPELGVAAVLPAVFDRATLLAVLTEHATTIARISEIVAPTAAVSDSGRRGQLVAVTGAGGTGTSVVAMGLAQAFSTEPSDAAMVLLADLALDAEQAMLHDAREVMPGLQEITEAHRAGVLPVDQLRSLTFAAGGRGYQLLLGLRRHRDWTAIRPRAFAAALDGMLRAFRLVIADVDADLEGEELTGSVDVEDRNAIARATVTGAAVVIIVGNPTTKGLHSLGRTIRGCIAAGVDPERIIPVCNRAPRGARRRSEAVAALAALLGREPGLGVGNPVFLPDRSDVEQSIRDGVVLPLALCRPLHAEVVRRVEALPSHDASSSAVAHTIEPMAVVPGSLGSWTEEAG